MYSRKHYLEVLENARESLKGENLVERASACGFGERKKPGGGHTFIFDSLGSKYELDAEAFEIKNLRGGVMPLIMRGVALHHLLHARRAPITGDFIPLRELPGLEPYSPVITRRIIAPLDLAFGDAPSLLDSAAAALGGASRVNPSGAAAVLFPFPMLPVFISVSAQTCGVPSSATVLFDASAPLFLPLEDIVVLAELTARKIALRSRDEIR